MFKTRLRCDERHTKWWRNNDVLKCMRMIDVGPFSYDYLLIYNSWLIERAQNIPFVFFLFSTTKLCRTLYGIHCSWMEKKMAWRLPTILPLKKEGMGNMISVFVQHFDRCFFYIPLEFMYFFIFCTFAPGECVLNIF